MNLLLEKFNDYSDVTKYKFWYKLSNGTTIDFSFSSTDFPHLIGLHKLSDIPIIGRFNDKNDKIVSSKYIIGRIKKENLLTDTIIRKSMYYSSIENRYLNFSKDTILNMSYTDVIIDFNPKMIHSKLNAKYILFNKEKSLYNHLAIGQDFSKKYYIESYFTDKTDNYIKNQKIVKIIALKITDPNGKIYLEDTFN